MSTAATSTKSTATPTAIKKLLANIPCLKPNGANWAIFKMCFSSMIKVTQRWGYFIGLKSYPLPVDLNQLTTTEAKAIEEWEYEDSVTSYLLSQRLSDTTKMHLANCSTTWEQWTMVSKDYQAKSAYAQANLHQVFLEMWYAKGANMREFLTSLCYKCKELAAARVQVTNTEYQRTILWGIPSELATFVLQLLLSILIINKAASVNLDALINQIYEEAD